MTDYKVDSADIDEDELTCDDPRSTAERLALAKADAVAVRHPNSLVIGADTVVAFLDSPPEQLAKPLDEEHAAQMLGKLSGRTHTVFTGVALVGPDIRWVGSDETRVSFRHLTDQEIRRYVSTGEPMDKAGAYAIQGGAATFILKVEGSISNVIGLPLELLRSVLKTREGQRT